MVSSQIETRGISSKSVLKALRNVPRHLFISEDLHNEAYSDNALGLTEGQTISQPYIVAYMTELLSLSPDSVVLEIGTGSGYQTAVLAEIVKTVCTIEVRESLGKSAKELLSMLGYVNIQYHVGNGAELWPEDRQFDQIIVTAVCEKIPEVLFDQLKPGGKLVIPVGVGEQRIHLIAKGKDSIIDKELISVRFVPFLWPENRAKRG